MTYEYPRSLALSRRSTTRRNRRRATGLRADVRSTSSLALVKMSPDGPPETGDLVLLGSTPDDRRWLIRVRRDLDASDAPCFYANWLGRDAGDTSVDVVMNGVGFGVRLPKAVSFTSVDERDGTYAVWRATFCLDGEGQLLSSRLVKGATGGELIHDSQIVSAAGSSNGSGDEAQAQGGAGWPPARLGVLAGGLGLDRVAAGAAGSACNRSAHRDVMTGIRWSEVDPMHFRWSVAILAALFMAGACGMSPTPSPTCSPRHPRPAHPPRWRRYPRRPSRCYRRPPRPRRRSPHRPSARHSRNVNERLSRTFGATPGIDCAPRRTNLPTDADSGVECPGALGARGSAWASTASRTLGLHVPPDLTTLTESGVRTAARGLYRRRTRRRGMVRRSSRG